jgi:hypothetical protein
VYNGAGNWVSVYLGDGTGALRPPTNWSVDGNAHGLVAADLNADGIPDLVTAGPEYVDVYLGNGDGTFRVMQQYPLGTKEGEDVAAGDINGDGIPDLATANENNDGAPDSVSTLLGNGDGSFQNAVVTPMGGDGPLSVQIGDLDGDGKGDVTVATYYDQRLHVFYGNGSSVAYPLIGPQGHRLVDVNGDGRLDVVVGQFLYGDVGVMLNRGDGTLLPVQYDRAGGARVPAVGDLNHDGRIDIAANNGHLGGTVSWLLGNGDGTFQPYQSASYGQANDANVYIAMGDLNRDGFDDLAVPTYQNLYVFINNRRWPQRHTLSGGSLGPPSHVPPAPPAPGGGPYLVPSRPAALDPADLSTELPTPAGPRKRASAAPRAFLVTAVGWSGGLTRDALEASVLVL